MSSIWNTALNILARREHSRAELKSKLAQRFPEQIEEVERVLDRLIEHGLQDDNRFVEMWLRSQFLKGRGPVRIRGEAKRKGVESLISVLLEESDFDWFESALEIGKRKFPAGIAFKDKAKAYRFLTYKGFQSDQVQYVINELSN